MNAVLALSQAVAFAASLHTDQRRKGARGEPYFNHLAEVAQLLAEATDGSDPVLVIAGLLHDSLEDTALSVPELAAAFGPAVAALVVEVSDDKSQPKFVRKRQQLLRAAGCSDRARMIKIADKISNLQSLIRSPPAGWPQERCYAYFEWAWAVVAGCRGVNQRLEAGFDACFRQGLAEINISLPAIVNRGL